MSLITVTTSIGCGAMSVSQSEAFRIRQKLSDISIAIDRIVINKLAQDESTTEIEKEFKEQKIGKLRLAPAGLIGYNVLKNYIEANTEAFEER
jgi:hypothetical protein